VKAAGSGQRAIHILRVAIRHLTVHLLHASLRRWPTLAAKIPGLNLLGPNLRGPERLRIAIEEMGGTFIKFGQMMAMQSDLLPLDYCRVLFTLFDQVPAFSYEEVEGIFQEELKQTPLQVFTFFDRTPIATGSIGQVHVAALGTDKVAVKIRRPTILTDFAADIAFMALAGSTGSSRQPKSLFSGHEKSLISGGKLITWMNLAAMPKRTDMRGFPRFTGAALPHAFLRRNS
jgi:predicted unusual protein kinase regulating ubiquinone biosynthesis (AarF/ABC1/UbiB family)